MLDKPVTEVHYDRARMLDTPEAEFDKLRVTGGLVWSRPLRRWMAISRPVASEALKNRDLRVYDVFRPFSHVSERTGVDLSDLVSICSWIPFLHDGPSHAALRSLFARLLSGLKKEYLAAFEKASAEMLNTMCAKGGGDLARDYAERLHAEAIGALAGFSGQERLWLAEISASQGSVDFAASVAEMVAANDRAGVLLNRLKAMVARPAAADLMARIGRHLGEAGIDDTPVNRLECLTALILLGRDTLAGTVTLGMCCLLDAHAGRMTAGSWGDPLQITDEFLRLSSTVQISMRVAARDITLADQHISESEVVMVFLPAANHDPDVYACPHAVRVGQSPPHIAFGAGRHLCTGMPLARSAVEIVIAQLADIGLIEELPGRTMDDGRITRKLKNLPCRMES